MLLKRVWNSKSALLFVKAAALCCLMLASAHAEMNEDWKRFEQGPSIPLSWQHMAKMDDYHWVFVGGYFNETVRGQYFAENAKILKDLGATQVTRLFPSSFRSARDNAGLLKDQLMDLHSKGGHRPIMLIGHSKGGLESMACILEHPELIQNNVVSEVVLVQAPVGGNRLTDSQGPLKQILIKSVLFPTAYRSLQTDQIHAIVIEKIKQLSSETRNLLSPHIHYVISSKHREQMGRALKALTKISVRMNTPYDGLVTQKDMWIPEFGEVLGQLMNVDHLEVVLPEGSLAANNANEKNILGFTKSLVANLFKSMNPNNNEYKALTQKLSQERNRQQKTKSASGQLCKAVF